MKATDLTDNLLSNDKYESFKSVMEGCYATFTATELPHEPGSVKLRRCRVVYDSSLDFVRHGSPRPTESEAEWHHILGVCKQFGFDPK
jgi:hypothetical protein